jgi:hypothetical protein
MDFWVKILYINALKYQPDIKYLRAIYMKPSPIIINTTKPQADSVQRLILKIHLIKKHKNE